MNGVINSLNKNMPLIEKTITTASDLSSDASSFLQNTQNNLSDLGPIIKRDLQILNSVSASAANSASALIEAINSNYEDAPQRIDDLTSKLNNLHNVSSNIVGLLTKINQITNGQHLNDSINKLNTINSKLETSINILNTVKSHIEANEQPSLTKLNSMLTLLNDVNSITSNLVNNYDSTIKNPINKILNQGIGGF